MSGASYAGLANFDLHLAYDPDRPYLINPPRYDEIYDRYLYRFIKLIERCRSHFNEAPLLMRLRCPYVQYLAFNPQLISRSNDQGPTQLIQSGTYNSPRGFKITLNQQFHRNGSSVPTACSKTQKCVKHAAYYVRRIEVSLTLRNNAALLGSLAEWVAPTVSSSCPVSPRWPQRRGDVSP